MDPLEYHEDYEYDADNNVIEVTDKRGNIWSYPDYDANGNCETAITPYPLEKTTTYTYNGHSKMTSKTNPLGDYVVWTYDGNDNCTDIDWYDDEDTLQAHVEFDYPNVNNRGLPDTKTDDNNHTTTYTWDADTGDLLSIELPSTNTWIWTYDGLGAKISQEDPEEQTIEYVRDEWQRMVEKDLPGPITHTFEYDAEGNLTEMVDPTGTTAWAYDDAGRKLTESKDGHTITYTYDDSGKLGLLSTMADYTESHLITYSYTDRNELMWVTEESEEIEDGFGGGGGQTNDLDPIPAGTTVYHYDENGNLIGIDNKNQTHVVRTYDEANRIDTVVNTNDEDTTLSSYDYTLNDNDQITGISENGGDTQSFDYDPMHHLISAARTGTGSYSETYVVDGNGNRVSKTVGEDTYEYEYSVDDELIEESLDESPTKTWTYDLNGNQLTRTVSATAYTLNYDAENQMTSIATGGGTVRAYTYDGLGRRVSRTASSTTTSFWYDGSELSNERVSSAFTATYVNGLGLIHRETETPLYDAQGNSRKVTNEAQSVTSTKTYDAFGNVTYTSGSTSTPYKYVGMMGCRDDGDAGLIHMGARYYDPYVGRFTTRDSILTEHPYVYCDGDPVNQVDPSGHQQGTTLQIQTNLARAVAEGDVKTVETIIEALTDSDTARIVGQAMRATKFPEKMGTSASKLRDALGYARQILEHAKKLAKDSPRDIAHHIKEVQNFFKGMGQRLKIK